MFGLKLISNKNMNKLNSSQDSLNQIKNTLSDIFENLGIENKGSVNWKLKIIKTRLLDQSEIIDKTISTINRIKRDNNLSEEGSIIYGLNQIGKKLSSSRHIVNTKIISKNDRYYKDLINKFGKEFEIKEVLNNDVDKSLKLIHQKFGQMLRKTKVLEMLSKDPIGAIVYNLNYISYPSMMAYSFINSEVYKDIGYIILIKKLCKEDFLEYAYTYLNKTSNKMLVSYALFESIKILSRIDEQRFFDFITLTINEKHEYDTASLNEAVCQLTYYKNYELLNKLILQNLNVIKNSNDVERKILNMILSFNQREVYVNRVCKKKIAFGLLDYKLPSTLISSNIGDYVQTMAMFGQLINSGIIPSDDTIKKYSFMKYVLDGNIDQGHNENRQGFDYIVLNRDNIQSSNYEKVWLPFYGWCSHKNFDRTNDITLDENINPLFISIHIARADFLSDNNVAILKKYEPIGCRDYNSVRILRSLGIRAFFSGCVTATLGEIYTRAGNKYLHGKYASAYKKSTINPNIDEEFISHDIKELLSSDFNSCMVMAHGLLLKYKDAINVRTNLLHCYMPCKGMNVPVIMSPICDGDRRFEGLINISKNELEAIKRRYYIFKNVLRYIASNHSDDEVYSLWKKIWINEENKTTDYLTKLDLRTKNKNHKTYIPEIISSIKSDRIVFSNSVCCKLDEPVEVVFASDRNLVKNLAVTVRSLLSKTNRNINLSILGRNICMSDFDSLYGIENLREINLYDCTDIKYGNLKLLDHTNVSTMDRLLIPELLKNKSKAIYLDVDVLVRKDIGELWDICINDTLLAARPSIHKQWRNGLSLALEIPERFGEEKAKKFRNWYFTNGKIKFDTFNAGVLLLNLNRLRTIEACDFMLSIASEYGLHDQFCLNILTRDNYLKLDAKWNYFYSQENIEDPAIVHFIGKMKPWSFKQLPFSEEWRDYII